jgi:hypothetical protein
MRIHPGICRPIMHAGQATFGELPGKYTFISARLIGADLCAYMHS